MKLVLLSVKKFERKPKKKLFQLNATFRTFSVNNKPYNVIQAKSKYYAIVLIINSLTE